jgi:signal transduction histidine kinase
MTILGLCFSGSAHGVPDHLDPLLVVVSYLVAAFASFTALEMSERLRGSRGAARWRWQVAAAVALGGGVWSMHFVGMLAFKLPISQGYDPALTILSALVAIGAVALGLQILGNTPTWRRIAGAGLLVGLGIAVMHYAGMAALRVPGQIFYKPGLSALSVLISIAAATAALWLALALRFAWQRGVAALVMAVAVCGMHYVGMAASVIVAGPLGVQVSDGLIQADALAGAVVASVTLIFCLGLVCVYVDRRLGRRAVEEAVRLRELNAALAERTESLTVALVEIDEARRVEAANQARTQLLTSMSHELRTPLNAVLGFAEVMRMNQTREPLTPRQGEAIGYIIDNGRHLLTQIEAMLDLAQLDAGHLEASPRCLQLAAIVDEVCRDFAWRAAQATLALSREPDDIASCAVRADPARLRQVLSSLISNAIKYNRPGGEIHVAIVAAGDRVEIVIGDTGTGIPAGRLANLFQPFDRLGREGGAILGVGIGLAVSRRLIVAMGGELRVESIEGLGSTFTVILPMAEPETSRGEPAARAHAA